MGSRQLKFANAGAGGPLGLKAPEPNRSAISLRNPLAPRTKIVAPQNDDDLELDFGDDGPKQKRLFSMKAQPVQQKVVAPTKKTSYD